MTTKTKLPYHPVTPLNVHRYLSNMESKRYNMIRLMCETGILTDGRAVFRAPWWWRAKFAAQGFEEGGRLPTDPGRFLERVSPPYVPAIPEQREPRQDGSTEFFLCKKNATEQPVVSINNNLICKTYVILAERMWSDIQWEAPENNGLIGRYGFRETHPVIGVVEGDVVAAIMPMNE